MSINLDDKTLIDQIKLGKEAAFRQLFDKYFKVMSYAAYKTIQDEHKSKDCAQEVFLDLWKRRETLEIHTSVAAFLKRATTFKAIDYIRKQKHAFQEVEEHDALGFENDNLEFNELNTLIHSVIEKLPERCRLVFSLSRFEQLSHKEIAQKLEISEKTIENQITKALRILRKTVKDYKLGSILLIFLKIY